MIKKTIPHPDKTILNSGEACGYLDVSWNTLKSLIKEGEIRAIRIGRRYLIPKESIDKFVYREEFFIKSILSRVSKN